MFKSTQISKTLRGGEMMKILGLVLALGILVTGACVADTASVNIYAGYQLVSVPLAPLNPAPSSVFANTFASYPAGANPVLSTSLLGNGVTYLASNPGAFGGIQLGQGYWIKPKTGAPVETITGFPNGLADTTGGTACDMWISLPGNAAGTGGAWHMIGQPFNHITNVDDVAADGMSVIRFTNGTLVKGWADAVAAGWVDSRLNGSSMAPGYGGGFVVSYNPAIRKEAVLRPGFGYQLLTKVPNLAMIIMAAPAH